MFRGNSCRKSMRRDLQDLLMAVIKEKKAGLPAWFAQMCLLLVFAEPDPARVRAGEGSRRRDFAQG